MSLRRFAREGQGSVLAISALLLPLIAGATLFGIDHMRAGQQVSAMQKAADAAALASAQQLGFVLLDGNRNGKSASAPGQMRKRQNRDQGEENETLTAIASGLINATLVDDYPDLDVVARIVGEDMVVVSVTARYGSLFGEMGAFGENPFTVRATARSFGGHNICIIALGGDGSDPGIEMEGSSQLVGEECEIYSNADRVDSLAVTASARIEVPFICSAGGYSGSGSNYSTLPATDCPEVEDPLATRKAPPFNDSCDHNNLTLDGGTHTLEPGTYCGKTDIKNGADVWLNEGIYAFREGELHVHDTGRLAGTGVGLYFDDEKAFFRFMDEGEIDLTAPTNGPMAGILVAANPICKDDDETAPNCGSGRKFSITSSNVRSLLGTIHLPTDEMEVDTTMPVSSEAAFTIIVIGRMFLKQSPTLVLNSDYDATNVPVPPGFRSKDDGLPRLIE